MLGAQPLPNEGSVRDDTRPVLRTDPRRAADSSEWAFAVLDTIERTAPEEARLARLVEAARHDDPFAFADLYIALFDRVHRWLQIALKDREDASDAAQQVFLRAFEALPRYQETGGFRAWVFSIARNLAYDRLHAASRSTQSMDPALLPERADDSAERFGEGGIQSMIDGLPAAQQRVLTLRFVSDLSHDDIGDLLGVSADAVRHTQQRALRSLARTLGPRGPGLPAAREMAERPRQVPIPPAEELHRRGEQHRADDRRVDQDCCRQAHAHLLKLERT
jgi:RNA polymerase sigma-70 factor (ECF subfamily)